MTVEEWFTAIESFEPRPREGKPLVKLDIP